MSEATEEVKQVIPFMNKANANRIKEGEEELKELLKDSSVEETEVGEQEEKVKEPESAEERTFKKRYADLRRHSQKKEEELAQHIKELEANRNKELPVAREDVEKWVEEYPDVAAIVQTLSKDSYADQSKNLEDRIADIERRDNALTMKEMEAKIRSVHSDYESIKDDEKFHAWADKQPKVLQDALYDNTTDPNSVIRVLDLYKVDTGAPKKTKKKASAAETIRTKGEAVTPTSEDTEGVILESDVDKMSSKEYALNEEAILESLRTGRFVYDLSAA